MSMIDHMTKEATTKRANVVDRSRGEPTDYLSGVVCTPRYPDDRGELRLRLGINTPVVLWQVFALGHPDIRRGDVLVLDETEYDIRSVALYDASPSGSIAAFTELVIEQVIG